MLQTFNKHMSINIADATVQFTLVAAYDAHYTAKVIQHAEHSDADVVSLNTLIVSKFKFDAKHTTQKIVADEFMFFLTMHNIIVSDI